MPYIVWASKEAHKLKFNLFLFNKNINMRNQLVLSSCYKALCPPWFYTRVVTRVPTIVFYMRVVTRVPTIVFYTRVVTRIPTNWFSAGRVSSSTTFHEGSNQSNQQPVLAAVVPGPHLLVDPSKAAVMATAEYNKIDSHFNLWFRVVSTAVCTAKHYAAVEYHKLRCSVAQCMKLLGPP